MDNVFIVGFPLKTNTTPNQYPIYKGATIASEPYLYKVPMFYVDGKTKRGMSGSAVVKKHGMKVHQEPTQFRFNEGRLDLIGVYSGRDAVADSEYEAELGIVWPFDKCVAPIIEKVNES